MLQQLVSNVVRDSDNGGSASLTATTTNPGTSDSDPNLKTLQEFKKSVLEEQKEGEKKIDEINNNLEDVKKQIDSEGQSLTKSVQS
jgi:peptidoglycan hydrolase CwlO-like protein